MVIQWRKFLIVELDSGDRVTSCQQLFAHCVQGEDMAASVVGVEDEDRGGEENSWERAGSKGQSSAW